MPSSCLSILSWTRWYSEPGSGTFLFIAVLGLPVWCIAIMDKPKLVFPKMVCAADGTPANRAETPEETRNRVARGSWSEFVAEAHGGHYVWSIATLRSPAQTSLLHLGLPRRTCRQLSDCACKDVPLEPIRTVLNDSEPCI
eukprot:5381216-Amphidinium_carterae.1